MKLIIEKTLTLTAEDLATLSAASGKSSAIGGGVSLLGGSGVEFMNLPTGVTKGDAARVVAARLLREELAKGTPLGEISWSLEEQTRPAYNEIWYESTNGQIVTPTDEATFGGLTIVSNTITDGLGVIKFSGVLREIGPSAFSGKETLATIEFPDGVQSVGAYALANCGNEMVGLLITRPIPPTVGEQLLGGNPEAKIYVPADLVETYQGAWPEYISLIEAEPEA